MTLPRLFLLLLLLPIPALAQSGVLQLPKTTTTAPQPPPPPPQAAPVTPVQQVGPHSDHAAHAAHAAKSKPTPVVQAPANVHAQRPPSATVPAAVSAKPMEVPSPAAAAAASDKGSVTGMPVPRWVALRSDEVNLRVGPGTRFPIEWQYHRRDLPVQILREVEIWRLIVDQDGVKGWVHQATLVGHRSFVVKQAEAVLRRAPAEDAAPVARLKQGVVGHLRSCAAGAAWCEVQVGEYRGFLLRDEFWGTFAGEAVN